MFIAKSREGRLFVFYTRHSGQRPPLIGVPTHFYPLFNIATFCVKWCCLVQFWGQQKLGTDTILAMLRTIFVSTIIIIMILCGYWKQHNFKKAISCGSSYVNLKSLVCPIGKQQENHRPLNFYWGHFIFTRLPLKI